MSITKQANIPGYRAFQDLLLKALTIPAHHNLKIFMADNGCKGLYHTSLDKGNFDKGNF